MKASRLLVLLLLLAGLSATAQTKTTYPFVERDSTLYLDVHQPAVARADHAAVLAVFGGGFIVGRRDDAYQSALADSLVQRGFTVISIDYRLGLKDSVMVATHQRLLQLDDLFHYCIDIATEDCAAAVAWVCEHADEIGIDPAKIALTGSSAGAITVLQLDYCRANGLPQAEALPKDWKPAAVIPYAGGVMCRKKDLRYATPPAPTLLMHGTKDRIVAYKGFGVPFHAKLFGSKTIDKKMNGQDIPHWFIRFEGIGHEVASWFPGSVDLFCGFVEQALSGRVSHLDATMSDSQLKPTEWTRMGLKDIYKR
ncbi:MAG: alpha/beta hydrolase fold domain-containing protein [Bacteroidales bacterium]|nr:alpha/beta hydrolase fold domain-containing protein [Bacteroidales bacterium]